MEENSETISLQIRRALDRGESIDLLMAKLELGYRVSRKVLQKMFLAYMKKPFSIVANEFHYPPPRLLKRISPRSGFTEEKLLAFISRVENGATITETAPDFSVKHATIGGRLRRLGIRSKHRRNPILAACGYTRYKLLAADCQKGPCYLPLSEADWEKLHTDITESAWALKFFPLEVRRNLGRRTEDGREVLPDESWLEAFKCERPKRRTVPTPRPAHFAIAAE
jgi:hypothetical protein